MKYKRCCHGRLPGHEHLGHRTRALLKENRYLDALYAARADVTQYTIWHKSHTVPAIRMGMSRRGSLLEIDIRALSELVDMLLLCHVQAGRLSDFSAALERLRANIDDPRWQRKIIYFHAMAALGPDWDEPAGRAELRKLGAIEEDDDIETIQVYLDLFGNELTFSQKNDLADRILAQTEKLSDRLHYKGLKAVLYLEIGDTQRAEAEIGKAVAQARSSKIQMNFSGYENYRLAAALELLGTIRNDEKLLDEAIELYESLLKSENWSPLGKVNLLRQMADVCKVKGSWNRACELYVRAYETKPLEIFRVLQSECLLLSEQLDEALKLISGVRADELSQVEFVDYSFVWAAIAIETGRRDLLEAAERVLKQAIVAEPYFRERRDSLLLGVLETLRSGKSQTLVQKARQAFAGGIRSTTTYLILKPTFMGIGVDVGKIVEDIVKGSNRHSQEAAPKRNDTVTTKRR
jgi:tetratricopeptide (TPR) repeat protein